MTLVQMLTFVVSAAIRRVSGTDARFRIEPQWQIALASRCKASKASSNATRLLTRRFSSGVARTSTF